MINPMKVDFKALDVIPYMHSWGKKKYRRMVIDLYVNSNIL